MRRLIAFLTLAGLLAAPAAEAKKATTLPTLVFPVVGGATFYMDDFGDPRPQGSHEGNELMGPRNTPLVAVEDGVIETHVSGRGGLMLYLRSKTREYLYIHLSNDKTDEDDNSGGPATAFAPGIRDGVRVKAGQHIANLGDSGDAAGIAPHLHFEEHTLDGHAVNPYGRLRQASIVAFASPAPGATASNNVVLRTTAVSLDLTGRLAWIASWPDGTGRIALRLERMGLVGTPGFDNRQLVILTAPAEALAAAEALAVGSRVHVVTAVAPPTLARQAMRPGAWGVATIEAAPPADAAG
jgi:hypothetical protein